MSGKRTYSVNVVAYESDGVWFAQCIEFDISAWSEHFADLPDAFAKELSATCAVNQHLGRDGLDRIPPAPDRFRRMLDEAAYDLKPRSPRLGAETVEIETFGISHQAA